MNSHFSKNGVLVVLLTLSASFGIDAQRVFTDSNPPDYSNLRYWAAHPDKENPAKLVPKAKRNSSTEILDVDIFFIHPTTFTKKKPEFWNGDLNNSYLNDVTDSKAIKYQASIFNQVGQIYAPRYRQAHLSAYWNLNRKNLEQVFDLAYSDVKNAFEYYMKYFNAGKPFIIASHSQGTTHAKRLMMEVIDRSPELQNQMVVAYLVGMDVKTDEYENIFPCEKPDEIGCFTSWRTIRKGSDPPGSYPIGNEFVVTNPLSWDANVSYADKSTHIGAVLKRFNKVCYNILEAECDDGILWVSKPKFPFSFLMSRKNYHIADYNFFYYNVQENAIARTKAYLGGH